MPDYKVEKIQDGSTIDLTDVIDSFTVKANMGFVQELEMTFELGDATFDVGDTIQISGTHGTLPLTKIFYGWVGTNKEGSREGEKYLTVTAKDVTLKLEERTISKRYVSQGATSILLDILAPLISEGWITTDNVETNTSVYTLTVENKTLLEAVNTLADISNWDWYIDPNRDLHFFQVDSKTLDPPLTLNDSDLNNYSYKKDIANIVNRITILGAKYNYPTNQDWCESLTGTGPTGGTFTWSPPTGGTIDLPDKTEFLPPQSGSVSVRSAVGTATGNYLELDFGGVLDFSKIWSFKTLNMKIGNEVKDTIITEVSIYLMKDISNYYSSGNLASSFDKNGGSWVNVILSIGPDSNFSPTGTISWSEIQKIRIKVVFQGTASSSKLYVDGLFFSDGNRKGFYEDTASQSAWGLHEIPYMVRNNVRTDQECYDEAKAVVEGNTIPADVLEDLTSVDLREEFKLGYKVTISVPETTITSRTTSFDHVADEGDLYTSFSIASTTKTASEIVKEHEERLGTHETETT